MGKSTDMPDISQLSGSLTEKENGLWVNSHISNTISYPQEHHDQLANEQKSSFWYAHRARCILKILNKDKTEYLLDVGGSNGFLAKHLTDAGHKIILLEPHLPAIRNAIKLGLSPVIMSGFRDANFNNGSVANVGLFDVLEHIEKDEEFLTDIFNKLEPGGKLYLTVPAYQSLWSDFDKRVGHFRRYSKNSLTESLEASGFTIKYFTYLFHPLPVLIWLKRKVLGKFASKDARSNHVSKKNFAGRILNIFLATEVFMVNNYSYIPFGSSCLCIAEKPS